MGALVSVIIPSYNRERLLSRAIDSALAQSHPDLEVIVVDDGSTDRTQSVLHERYGGDPRVRVFSQANAGVCAARNRALAEARGRFVAFLDFDDVWKPWKLELQLASLAATPEAGMIWTDMHAIGPDGAITHWRYLKLMYNAYRWFGTEQLFADCQPLPAGAAAAAALVGEDSVGGAAPRLWVGDIYGPMTVGSLVHTSTVLVRRERLDKVGGFDESFGRAGEDHDFHLRTCREGPVAFLDLPSVYYQIGMDDQLSHLSASVARNYMRTLQRELASHPERIRARVPARVIRRALSEAHRWLGEAMLEEGDRTAARRHLVASLLRQPLQARAATLAAATLLPSAAEDRARAAWRRFRRAA